MNDISLLYILFMEYIDAKSILIKCGTNQYWFNVNFNMNIYKGCNHGCIYCDSRSEKYGLDKFNEVLVKKNALNILEQEMYRTKKIGIISTGSMSDPYNPYEKDLQLTRKSLELMNRFGFGVVITTKSDLVLRDIDLLKEINKKSPVLVLFTITTADKSLCKQIEPNVCSSSKRFAAIQELSKAGIKTGILIMPVLPFINDTNENIYNIIRKTEENGSKCVFTYGFGVTLRDRQREYFYQKLREQFPQRNLVNRYISTYKYKYSCSSPRVDELMELMKSECKKRSILYQMKDIVQYYQGGYSEPEQLSIFDFM